MWGMIYDYYKLFLFSYETSSVTWSSLGFSLLFLQRTDMYKTYFQDTEGLKKTS